MSQLLENLLNESLIDFAQDTLCPAVWKRSQSGEYAIQPLAETAIFDALIQYPDEDLKAEMAELRIVGSITTNLYDPTTDVDVHLIPKQVGRWSEKKVSAVQNWYNENRRQLGMYVGTHPIEIYIQLNPHQDLMSEGVYDLLLHKWVKGPKLMPQDYNPYEDFSDVLSDMKDTLVDADALFGEIRRDIIDYETIQKALSQIGDDKKKNILRYLEVKLDEIESSVEQLVGMRKDWVDRRKTSSQPTSAEQALKDAEMVAKWKDTNAFFKFLNRYHYLKVIQDLRDAVGDDLDSDEISSVKRIVGGPNV